MNEISSFGNFIRRRRKSLDLTQADLARQVYCSLSTIKKIELDERHPSSIMAERLAQCLQIEGSDRESFLAAAIAEMSFDRLNLPVAMHDLLPAQSNLTAYLPSTPFIGYRNELAELSRLITDQGWRLISLVGPGGIGKTRLALQLAMNLAQKFSGGVFFISLSQVETSEYLASAIQQALSLTLYPGTNVRSILIEYLKNRSMLLVLDNFEHLLDGSNLLVDLLHASPGLVLIITTRIPLSLSMEYIFEVRGMQVVSNEVGGQVFAVEAVELFVQSAQRAGGKVNSSHHDLDRVLRICKLVDGFPLAIELAAAWARKLSNEEIESGIMNSLDFLSSSMHDADERHRSIRAAFDFSWLLLSAEEQHVFSTLSVFHGGFELEAVREIAGAQPDTLVSLVNKSLLYRSPSGRFEMHELLRRFAEIKSIALDEQEKNNRLHLIYFLKVADGSITGRLPRSSSYLLEEREIDNFRFALSTAIEQHEVELGLRLAVALGPFWRLKGYLLEGISWLAQVLKLEEGQYPSLRLQALVQSAWMDQEAGDYDRSISFCKQSLALSKLLNEKTLAGLSLLIYGTDHYLEGEFERGIRMLNKSKDIFQELHDDEHLIQALIRVGDVHLHRGMLDLADEQWQMALKIATRLDRKKDMAFSLGGLGDVQRLLGNLQGALDYHRRSLKINWEQHHALDIPFVMEALCMDLYALQQIDQAIFFWCAAEKMREDIHAPLPPSYQKVYSPVLREMRASLGEAAYSALCQSVRVEPIDQVIGRFLQAG